MFSRCRELSWATMGLGILLGAGSWAAAAESEKALIAVPSDKVLHVAADPNNLPFSNHRLEGFENKIVELVARELGLTVEYTWWAQRRGFFRNTLKEGSCDLVAGVPRGFDLTLTTMPYYRSTYVFVSRRDRALAFASLDDPKLRELKVGVQMVGDDFMNTPPAHALSRRGLVENVKGYTLYGDYREENPPARIVDAVVNGEVDVALVWGPLAGFFAKRHGDELNLTPIPADQGEGAMPFAFDICMGVRKTNPALRAAVNEVLIRKRADIDAILASYGVPRAEPASPSPPPPRS
jgi:mxaJ protein